MVSGMALGTACGAALTGGLLSVLFATGATAGLVEEGPEALFGGGLLIVMALAAGFADLTAGVVLGAPVGFALGAVDGLLLGTLTRAFYHPAPVDVRRYRKVAGRACVLAGVLVLAVDWMFHGFPDPAAFFAP